MVLAAAQGLGKEGKVREAALILFASNYHHSPQWSPYPSFLFSPTVMYVCRDAEQVRAQAAGVSVLTLSEAVPLSSAVFVEGTPGWSYLS